MSKMPPPEYRVTGDPIRPYRLLTPIVYVSKRYDGKKISVPKGYPSDGATGAFDIHSNAWWVHDLICDRTTWDCGTQITAWQASTVLADVLRAEGRWFRALYWQASTFLLGCTQTRKNGWF